MAETLSKDKQGMPSSRSSLSVGEIAKDVRASILIVDDHPANLLAVEAILLPLEHEIISVKSGEEALKQLLTHDFAVILMDVQMPGLDGFQTTRIIKERERSKHIPIIFLTAISREAAHIIKGYAYGAVDYLLKPFDPEVLRSKVQVFVDLYKQAEVIRLQGQLLREREREALERRNERRFEQLTDCLPVSMWAAKPDGSIHYANRVWREFCGNTSDLGAWNLASVHEEDAETARSDWQSAVQQTASFETQCRLRRHDAVYRWHIVRAAPELDEQGSVVGWIATALDVHDRKRAEEALQEASRAKDEFLAMVSHELRTPLHAVLGWAELLKEGNLGPDKLKKAIDTIERNARTQARLVEDMLDVSRIIAGKIRLDLKLMDPTHTVESAVEVLRPTALAKRIQLELEDDGQEKLVLGDAARLQQIVWNLVANAVKFTPEAGRVSISLSTSDRAVELSVRDNGRGIAKALLPFVFERFWQADTGARTQPGLGLGLAITRNLVELHGGSIQALSDGDGLGATFVVRLPVADARTTAHEDPPPASLDTVNGGSQPAPASGRAPTTPPASQGTALATAAARDSSV
ncbi:MAG TPA: ATP-binding protein [Polyangiaceae bacterium]